MESQELKQGDIVKVKSRECEGIVLIPSKAIYVDVIGRDGFISKQVSYSLNQVLLADDTYYAAMDDDLEKVEVSDVSDKIDSEDK